MLKRIYKVGLDELFNTPLLVPHSIRFVANNLIILAKFVMELGFYSRAPADFRHLRTSM